ncbi:hypothetical protein [Acetobacterium woodii]|uniref:Uncharacterized protein n=1 Tax=Acetobacterium woodii (strain ATCC 29683 / DSM 1030 / JCM 2381 / KCTC 1655 / WB1) TaxID=931626 RepID=H6LER6_ACEWD|nr:hypothetical protein Awo_c26030 [Acetobacterium woodii DSM 1030]
MVNNLKKIIQNAMNKSSNTPTFDTTKVNNEQEPQNQSNFDSEGPVIQKQRVKKKDKPLKVFGGICLALGLVTLIFFTPSTSVNATEAAKNALEKKISTSLPAGTVLLSKDENIGQQDYTITHKYENNDTKIWVWDYAAEDGDYVQVLINGAPVSEVFMIKHKPVEITVPAVGEVQIKGIRDGGGGITYAVRYDLNGTNYYNSAPEGEFNTYTLIKE